MFGEVAKRMKDFVEKNPGMEIFRLGIGDTTQPLTPTVIKGLKEKSQKTWLNKNIYRLRTPARTLD